MSIPVSSEESRAPFSDETNNHENLPVAPERPLTRETAHEGEHAQAKQPFALTFKEEIRQLDETRSQKMNELTTALLYLNSTPVGLDKPLVDSEGFPRDDLDLYAITSARHTVACTQNDLKSIEEELYNKLNALHEQTRLASEMQLSSHSSTKDAEQSMSETFSDEQEQQQEVKEKDDNNQELATDELPSAHNAGVNANANTMTIITKTKNNKEISDTAEKKKEMERLEPFLRIAHVDVNSPAFEGNLQEGDLIVQVSEVIVADESNTDGNINRAQERETIDVSNFNEFGKFIVEHEHKMLSFWVRRIIDEDNVNRGAHTEMVELFIVPQRWSGAGLLGCAFDIVSARMP